MSQTELKAPMRAPMGLKRSLDIPFVTIDAESTKDIDDAFHASKEEGGYRILVAIANPVKIVEIGSTEDQQARLMAATVYQRDRAVRHMLPPAISEQHGSLMAGKTRRALVFDIHLSESMEVRAFSLKPETIQVEHRLSYTDIPAMIKGGDHPARALMILASSLATQLLTARRNRGALALYDMSRLLVTDEEGRPRILHSTEEVIGQILIQEVMILSNHLAARFLVENNIPCILRNHEPRLAAPPSAQLANTIEAWVRGASFDAADAMTQFMAIAGRARYEAVAKGHYGLSLPFYTHVSSPLRRYADLVNMRQLVAFLEGRNLPYGQEDLAAMATDLNEALERRKEERSEGFKDVVRATAARAIDAGRLERLADHELRQAVKMCRDAGELPQQLIDELINRLRKASITDTLADTLMLDVSPALLTEPLRAAMAAWLEEFPARAVQMLMHARQTGFLTEFDVKVAEADGVFAATTEVVRADGQRLVAHGAAQKKKDAEKRAAIAIVVRIMNLPSMASPAPDLCPGKTSPGSPAAPRDGINWKGKLLELCQQLRWKVPDIEVSGKGPSHAMIFSCVASVTIDGQSYHAEISGGSTKKDAEAQACRVLLARIEGLGKRASDNQTGTGNPVGALQELMQKRKEPIPDYRFEQVSQVPPLFEATVTCQAGQIFRGRGATKQAAKTEAASQALAAMRE